MALHLPVIVTEDDVGRRCAADGTFISRPAACRSAHARLPGVCAAFASSAWTASPSIGLVMMPTLSISARNASFCAIAMNADFSMRARSSGMPGGADHRQRHEERQLGEFEHREVVRIGRRARARSAHREVRQPLACGRTPSAGEASSRCHSVGRPTMMALMSTNWPSTSSRSIASQIWWRPDSLW